MIGEPDGCPRFQKRRAKADTDAEECYRAPVDMRHRILPSHEADLRQHHEHDSSDGDSRSIKGMQFLFCDPEKEQDKRNAEKLLFSQGDRAHFLQHLINRFLPAGHFFHFRRHDMDQEEIENDRHDGGIGSGCDEPFQPADVLT